MKRPKIKQGTTSKVNYILFNRLLSPVLLNKSGLARAKAVNFNSNFLNKCFSNYYQAQTWPVFAETVTYPDLQQQARKLLKHGAEFEGYWNSDKFLEHVEEAIKIAKVKYAPDQCDFSTIGQGILHLQRMH